MAASPSLQPLAMGETNINLNTKAPYAAILKPQQTTQNLLKNVLKLIEFIHGEPTMRLTMEEREQFAREEGLHQAVITKFAYGKPVLSELRKLLPKQFDVKGNCNIGQVDFCHLLIRFDLYEDFVKVLASFYGYFKFDGEEYLFIIFLWMPSFNPKEETPKVWQLNDNGVGNKNVNGSRLDIEITAASKPIDLKAENSNSSIPIEIELSGVIGRI
ncbi:hypothetical protein H5410_045401 [Solanum commersonii]|uniref:DUF4283 domain-containing protein n=1 Tax=Solanum commersonii TaxID=4109 RepID=A0A9J5XBI0_SOLCO|nr:hypothetical protein H5410_045401 [Solanum commersonii]